MARLLIPRIGRVILAVIASVALASLAVAFLEGSVGVPDASSVYLVAVAAIAIRFGIPGAILTAVASVLVYDFLFVNPLHTLTVSDPGEWLNLVLLLFVAVTVGQLAAMERGRAEAALERERESRALFDMTRALAVGESTSEALPAIAAALARDAGMDQVWVAFGADDAAERVAARSDDRAQPWPPRSVAVLQRPTERGGSGWTVVRPPQMRGAPGSPVRHFRVRIEEAGRPIGSIWGVRPPSASEPGRSTSRLLQVAADLVAQSLAHERLIEERRRSEVARQSDELKTALLESVSHDLRTPLATIRAVAGTLIDPEVPVTASDTRAAAAAIDREAERLNRLVGNLLDLSRIEGGALRAADEAIDVEDLVTHVAKRDLGASVTLEPGGDRPGGHARPRGSCAAGTGAGQPARERRDARRPNVPGACVGRAGTGRRPRPPDRRGFGARRGRCGAISGVRPVLPRRRPSEPHVGDGHRPGRGSRLRRGDGRAGLGSSRRAGRARGRYRPPIHVDPGRRARPRGRVAVTEPGPRVLLVEDEDATRTALQRHLAARGYRVDEAHDVGSALTRWAARRPDVILLDLGLPDRDGTDLIRRIRREAETPILVLSARDAERTKVQALELGADDYVTKPFGTAELLARLRALLRRAAGPAADAAGRIAVGPLMLDAGRHAVTVDGRPVELTPREYEVLRVLLTHQGRLVTRGRLLRAVWGEAYQDEDHYVHVYVSQLRRKLAAADETGALRDLIATEPGIGYRVQGP